MVFVKLILRNKTIYITLYSDNENTCEIKQLYVSKGNLDGYQ